MNGEGERWHLSKAVPVSIIMFLIVQTIGLVIWATKLDSRVATLETARIADELRIGTVEMSRDKIILIEERQSNVMRQVDINAKKLDLIIEKVTQGKN